MSDDQGQPEPGEPEGTTATTVDADPLPSKRKRRHRSRRNVVGGSAHRAEIVSLIQAGWTSHTIERYAWNRWREDVPASTIREYKQRHKIEGTPGLTRAPDGSAVTPDNLADVVGIRADVIRLQVERIRMESERERVGAATAPAGQSVLFASLAKEVTALSGLLNDHRTDLERLGLLPVDASGDFPAPTGEFPQAVPDLPAQPSEDPDDDRLSLAEALNMGDVDEAAAARKLHEILPRIGAAGREVPRVAG